MPGGKAKTKKPLKDPLKQQKEQQRQKQVPKKPRVKHDNFESMKQARADPRMGVNGDTTRLDLSTQIKTLVEPLPISQIILEDWARGFVMKAMEKGFMSFVEIPSIPYFAYCYVVETMKALIVNDPQLAVNVPYVLLATCRALRTKSVPFGNGETSYSSSVDAPGLPAVFRVVGYVPYGYTWCLGVPVDTTIVNLRFPTLNNIVPGYTTAIGATAFQRLCQILVEDDPTGPFRLVLTSSKTELDNDVSAFAYQRPSLECIGLGTNGAATSGFTYPLNLEVPIFRPQFAALTSTLPSGALLNRFGNLHANCAGDGTFLAAGQASWFKEHMWKMQRPPKLHPVDFNEFVDVAAKWIVNIQQAWTNDPENGLANPADVQCALTLQEMSILLRNVVMTAFKETQAGVHALYPATPLSQNDDAFVPFVVGSNTCFICQTDMTLPVPLIENIRALVHRMIHRGGNDWEVFIPVLGQYNETVLSEDDYVYTRGPTEYPAFLPASTIGKKKKLGSEVGPLAPLAETVISLVDGSSSAGFVCINDPYALRQLTSFWEEWLKKSGVASYSTDVGVLGTEAGINALVSINMTRITGVLNIGKKKVLADKKKALEGLIDERAQGLSKNMHRPVQSYLAQEAVMDSSQSKILATAYEQIQSVWILPTLRGRVDDLNALTPVRWQAISSEPYAQVLVNNTQGITLDSLHANYAAKLVRGKLQPPTDWELLFKTLSQQGRGGILSGLVGKFADMIIPGAGDVVRTVGGAIGI